MYFHSTQVIPFTQFHTHHTWTFFWSKSYNPRLILLVPKTEQWVVRGKPTHPTLVSLFETDINGHFRLRTHQNTIYCINYTTNCPNSLWTVTKLLKWAPKIPTIRSQVLGPIKRPLTASINSIINKTLKQSVTQVG